VVGAGKVAASALVAAAQAAAALVVARAGAVCPWAWVVSIVARFLAARNRACITRSGCYWMATHHAC
jgi:hypothetical protein